MQNTYATSTSRLTTKTWHVINGALDIAIDTDEAEAIKTRFLEEGADFYETKEGAMIPKLGTQVLNAAQYDDYWHRKNGDFKCLEGNWHTRGQKCQCEPKSTGITREYCGKCEQGYIIVQTGDPMYPTAARACLDCNKAVAEKLHEEHLQRMRTDENYRQSEEQSRKRIMENRFKPVEHDKELDDALNVA